MWFLFEIPLGIWYFIIVGILFVIKFIHKDENKKCRINNIIYIMTLLLISSLMYSGFRGFPYPCPCGGCGSQEIDYGWSGVVSFFKRSGWDLVVYEAFYYFSYIVSRSIIMHIIVLFLKDLKMVFIDKKEDVKGVFMKRKTLVLNFFKHLHLVNKHRFKVFCLCVRAGEPWRGFVHDLSKYSPEEFFEGVKYFQGNYSPIKNCKMDKGYSMACLHHTGRNKHHYEYWYDYKASIPSPIIPYEYFVEMVCDSIAAGMIYEGKNWNQEYQMNYWLRDREKARIHPKMDKLLTKVYADIAKKGIKPVLKQSYLKFLYDRYTR